MPYYRAVAQAAAPASERIGVLVVNLGTPDSPSYLAVMRYLREFLSDRRVIDASPLLWLPILYGVVLPLRPLRTARKYRRIWTRDGSPLAVYSKRLTEKIESELATELGDRVRVALGMTYGHPSIAGAIGALAHQNVSRLLVLPLFPQYCSSTTGSVFDRTTRVLERWRTVPEMRFVNEYHLDAGYIEALAARIEQHWQEMGEQSHLLLSYHGIPITYVEGGDPYQRQAEATTRAIALRLGLVAGDYSHCYQSRFGRLEWLKPYLSDTLQSLLERGIKKVTVAAPSFAVDCLETLEEIGVEYHERFRDLGGERLSLVPALNDDARHAALLATLVRRELDGWL